MRSIIRSKFSRLALWNDFRILPPDNFVLQVLKEVIELKGLAAMRRLRTLWAAGASICPTSAGA